MADLKLIRTIKSKVASIPIENGQVIFCIDTPDIYMDLNNTERKVYTEIQKLTSTERIELLAPIQGFYFETDTYIIYYYTGTDWKQINNSLSVSDWEALEKLSHADGELDEMLVLHKDQMKRLTLNSLAVKSSKTLEYTLSPPSREYGIIHYVHGNSIASKEDLEYWEYKYTFDDGVYPSIFTFKFPGLSSGAGGTFRQLLYYDKSGSLMGGKRLTLTDNYISFPIGVSYFTVAVHYSDIETTCHSEYITEPVYFYGVDNVKIDSSGDVISDSAWMTAIFDLTPYVSLFDCTVYFSEDIDHYVSCNTTDGAVINVTNYKKGHHTIDIAEGTECIRIPCTKAESGATNVVFNGQKIKNTFSYISDGDYTVIYDTQISITTYVDWYMNILSILQSVRSEISETLVDENTFTPSITHVYEGQSLDTSNIWIDNPDSSIIQFTLKNLPHVPTSMKFVFAKNNEHVILCLSSLTQVIYSVILTTSGEISVPAGTTDILVSIHKDELSNLGISATYLVPISLSPKSTYSGKTYSILGHSIDAFQNGIISSYENYNGTTVVPAPFYPQYDVISVSDMWYSTMEKILQMNLCINNSSSGRTVAGTGELTIDNVCGQNAAHVLHSDTGQPDVIFITLGGNDFLCNVPLGEWNGKSNLPKNTVQNTFREAYAIMLMRVMTEYPHAEIFCCTQIQFIRSDNTEWSFPIRNSIGASIQDYNNAIKEIAQIFGAKVVDLNRCGITYYNASQYISGSGAINDIHPNLKGHSIIGRYMAECLDQAVRQSQAID